MPSTSLVSKDKFMESLLSHLFLIEHLKA